MGEDGLRSLFKDTFFHKQNTNHTKRASPQLLKICGGLTPLLGIQTEKVLQLLHTSMA